MAGRTSYYGGTVLDDLIFHIDAAKQESYSKKGIRYTQKGDGNILINFADTSKITSEKSPTGSIYGATFSNFVPFHKAFYSKYWHDKKSIEWTTSAGIGTFYGNIEFDGVNNYIDFGSTPEMDGNTDITVSTWFYVNNFRSGVATQGGTMSMIASRYNNLSTNNGWQLYFDNQGVLYFGGGESNALYIYATSSTLLKPANGGPYGNGGWYNAIGTKSGNTWKLYLAETNRSIVDNIIYEDSTIPVLEGTIAAGTGTTKFSTNKLIIGKSGDSSFDYAFDGRIMSLSIYNRALSISEITQNYKSMSKRVFKLVTQCLDCVSHDVTIGTQTWTGCNATVSTYRDGTPIPYVGASASWVALTTGAWCYVNGDPSTEATYGKLYNWYAINNLTNGGIAPVDYHVPTDSEWTTLTDYLGGLTVAGGKMKEAGLCHWLSPNTDATNITGFGVLPNGRRVINGAWYNFGEYATFWTSTAYSLNTTDAWYRLLTKSDGIIQRFTNGKIVGFSVRFIKDVVCTPSCGAWSYTYTAWSAWSTCATGTQTRTRTANGTRTCILTDCSTNIETSSTIEIESQACIPCPDCVAHDVTIGTQIWTGCNATVSTYNNGDPIPYVDNTASWAALTTGAWCYVNNDPSTEATYGKLYNWYAITDPRGIAPNGYIVPTDADWTTLTTFLGGTSVAGGKMKGLCHWMPTNIDATNTSLFTGLPGGYRDNGGYYNNIGNYGFWGSSTENNTINAWGLVLSHGDGVATRGSLGKKNGLSLRFIKNPCPNCVAHDVTIGTQIWTGCNATVETYEDGTIIPQVTNAGQWASLTTGAWCYYNNDPANAQYGKLYNWYAVAGIHNAASLSNPALRKKLAPTGYHVPSNTEFSTLFTTVGGGTSAGFHLREPGTCHWASTNNAMLNTYGFSALGGGTKDWDNVFRNLKNFGWWWTSQGIGTANAFYYRIDVNGQIMTSTFYSYVGMSVRFIKD